MIKYLIFFSLIFISIISHAVSKVHTGPDFSAGEKSKEIVSAIHTVLKVSFDDKPKDNKYHDRIFHYMDQFNQENKFTVERISSERLSPEDIYKYYIKDYLLKK